MVARKRNNIGSYVATNVPVDNSPDAGEFVIEDGQQYRMHHNKLSLIHI